MNTIEKTITASCTVRGHEIKRAPLGKFLEVLEVVRTLPDTLLSCCFPGLSAPEALSKLKLLDTPMMVEIVTNLTMTAPRQAIDIFSRLSGIPAETLLSDDQIGLDGLLEMISAWIDINGLVNFTEAIRSLMEKVRAVAKGFQKPKIGYSV